MGKAVICMGDSTSHGGKVLEGSPNAKVNGRPVAARGHKVFCPLCRGTFPIAEGVPFHSFAGMNTAVEGMRTACGAELIASQHDVTVDLGDSPSAGHSATAATKSENADGTTEPVYFDQHFLIEDINGRPLRDIPYILQVGTDSGVRGRTCEAGKTYRLETQAPATLSITVFEHVTPIAPNWDR